MCGLYLNATTAYDRLALTQQMLQQAQLSLDLAQNRYDLGLGSIVELRQAQLNVTSAQIADRSLRLPDATRDGDHEIGALH
jgi:outer membrane protein